MSTFSADENAVLSRILNDPNATHYQVLGVSTTATSIEIKRAYKILALQFHPDKYRGADEVRAKRAFPKVNDAYVVLIDPEERRRYDRELPSQTSQESSRSYFWNNRWSSTANTPPQPSTDSTSSSSSDRPTGSSSSGIAMATMLTGMVVSALVQQNSTFFTAGESDFKAHVASMMTFLRTVKEELDVNDEFVLQAGEAIMRGFADVFVEILPYLISVASTVSPSLAWKLSAAAAVGAFFAKDKVFTIFDWTNMNPQMRAFVIDGLMHYYQTARRR